ncbi:DUF4249 family protein [Rhodohalobacter sp. 614A]|uniref:DUF4249 family protein n=1 Tax=Rhodohalobacter sp. 614A TaxID=2908649 RepID=UPI001F3CCB03|nr:DUF4249 family protein [Rhodohalobacter sp. 614A]
MKKALLSIFFLVILYGCDLYEVEQFEETYAIESYLIADENLPQVMVTKTLPIGAKFNKNRIAIPNATVEISLLKADGSIDEKYVFFHTKSGQYLPETEVLVKPKRWYQLTVTMTDGSLVEAKTFVPDTFTIANEIEGAYVYQSNSKISISATPSSYYNRSSYYMFTAEAVETVEENLTPYYKDLVKDKGSWINSYYINSSEITNENKYKRDSSGNLSMEIPWSLFAFYGQNDVSISAIDDNIYDYMRSSDDITAGTTLGSTSVQNVKYNVTGGIGIFGSLARVTKRVEITP